jgi:tRNA U34 5-carboxymethylaminomethyl modifying GTPase MnmE/TrmE
MSRHDAALALSNAAAKGAFGYRVADIRERLAKLNALVEDNLGYSPDEINWGHVGTAAHVAAQLNDIVATLDILATFDKD